MTAGSTYRRSQVKSVWCTFRFLLQQKRSVSVSDGLNEGLVSRATGSRSTRPGVCVYYQSPCVYSGLHPVLPPLLAPASPARPPSHTQTATFTGASPDNSPSTPPATKPLLHHSTSPAHIRCSAERCGHTPSLNTLHFPALCRHVSTHMQHTDKVYEVNIEKPTPQKRKATHASSHACLDRNACAHTHIQYLYI